MTTYHNWLCKHKHAHIYIHISKKIMLRVQDNSENTKKIIRHGVFLRWGCLLLQRTSSLPFQVRLYCLPEGSNYRMGWRGCVGSALMWTAIFWYHSDAGQRVLTISCWLFLGDVKELWLQSNVQSSQSPVSSRVHGMNTLFTSTAHEIFLYFHKLFALWYW